MRWFLMKLKGYVQGFYKMYTNKSTFRIDRRYGIFTIPKGILNELGWEKGDLVEFLIVDGMIMRIQRACTKEQLEEFKKKGRKYNKKIYKKISNLGGETGTLGIKSAPEFLMKELMPKNGQPIYFLPARYTALKDYCSKEELNNLILATFDPNNLKRYEEKTEEDAKKDDEKIFKEIYHPPFFKGRSELTEKNSKRAKNKVEKINITANRDGLLGREDIIKKTEKWIKVMESSAHPQKKKIIQDLKKTIKHLESRIKKLEVNPVKRFKEWKE